MFLVAGVFFWFAVRETSERLQTQWQVITQLVGGTAAVLAGYESAFRTAAKSIWELKDNYATGMLFLSVGILALADVAAKAFYKYILCAMLPDLTKRWSERLAALFPHSK